MARSLPGRWTRLLGKRRPRSPKAPRAGGPLFRPNFEHLEERLAPTVDVWSGASPTSSNWNDPLNWVAKAVPQNGDDLVFPGGAAQMTTSSNNLVGASFHSIAIDAAGYTIGGNSLTLGAGGLAVNSAAGSGSDEFNAPIVLGASAAITDTYAGVSLQLKSIDTGSTVSGYTLTLGGSGNITVPNGIADGGSLVKSGPGTLTVASTSTYTGSTTIGAGIVQLQQNANLGSGVTVASGATLQIANNAILQQAVTLNGSGMGGGFAKSTAGALEILNTGFVDGTITLGTDATIGVDAGGSLTVQLHAVGLAGHTLTVNSGTNANAIFTQALDGGVANAGNLVVNSALTGGTVSLNAASTFVGTTTVSGGTLDLGGANGSLVSNTITVNPGATLLLDNSSGTSSTRIPSATASILNLDGGTLTLLSGSNAVTETAKTIKLTGGQSNIGINQGSAKLPTVLQAGSLVRTVGATVNFSSNATLGTAAAEALFTTAPTTTSVNGGTATLLPYVTVGDTDLATYSAGTGVAAFRSYILNPTSYDPTTDTTNVVKYTSTATLPAPVSGLTDTWAGLVIAGGSTLTVPVGLNLTLGSGGLLLNHGSIAPASLLGGNMTFSAEGVIYSNASAGANAITTQITGTHGMDLAGPAMSASNTANYLFLNPGTARNTWTGGTWLDSANIGLAGANPLGASTLTLVGGALATATDSAGIITPSSGVTFANALVFSAAHTTFNASNLTLSGSVGLVGTSVLTLLQPATLTGVISNSAPTSPGGLVELGSSTLTLQPGLGRGSNTYTGSTVVGGGALNLATQGNPLGAGALVLTGTASSGTTLENSVAGISLLNALVLSNVSATGGNPNVTLAGAAFTFAHPASLTGLTSLQVNAPVTISGAINGTGGLSVSGSGGLVLSGTNGYTGATMLTGGSLTLNGSQPNSAVAVSGGTLTGTGTLGFLTVGSEGTVSPSNPAVTPASPGILTAPGANFSEGGDLVLQIAGYTAGTYSQLNLGTGPLVVGGNAANAPSVLTLNLGGLSSTSVAAGAIVYGSQLGTVPVFSQLDVVGNPKDYTASLNYTATALNAILTTGINTPTDLAPQTTFIWTGASTTTNRWSDPANWQGNAVPTDIITATTTTYPDLVFPAGARQLSSVDDLPSTTIINSITVEGGGYTFNPLNASSTIPLVKGLTTTEPPDNSSNPLPTVTTINVPIAPDGFRTTFVATNPGTTLVLAGSISTSSFFDLAVDGSGTTTITGDISGGGGVVKNGTGTLNLWPAAGTAGNSFTGPGNFDAGIVTVDDPTSLGETNLTTVNAGATLETVGANAFSIAGQLIISGTGVGGNEPGTSLGALCVNNAGSLTLTGGISLPSSATIDNPLSSTQLNITQNGITLEDNGGVGSALTLNTADTASISVPIIGGVSGSQFIVNSGLTPGTGTAAKANLYNGTVNLTAANTYIGATIVEGGILHLTGLGTIASTDIEINTNAAQNAAGPLATLQLDDTGSSTGRLLGNAGNAPVLTFNGGKFVMTSNFNHAYKEVLASITLGQGQSFITTNFIGTKGSVELDFDHITRKAGGTLDFSGAGVGGTQNLAVFTNSTAPPLDSGGVFPYITVTSGGPTTYATYQEIGSSKTWQIAPFTSYVTNPALFTGNVVGEVSPGTTLPLTGTTTLADLLIASAAGPNTGGLVILEPGATLELLNGLLTSGAGNAEILARDSTASLTIGASNNGEGVVMSYSPTTLNTVLTDDTIAGKATGYTYAGTSTTFLAPPADSTYTGDTYIDSGTVRLETDNQPFGDPTKSTLHLVSGVLAFDAGVNGLKSTSATIPNNVSMSNSSAEFMAVNLAAGQTFNAIFGDAVSPGTFSLAGDATLAIPQNIDVTLNDQVTGTGTLNQTGVLAGVQWTSQTLVSSGSGGLNYNEGLVVANGTLYVVSRANNSILAYNATTGAFQRVLASGNGLNDPIGMVLGPDGDLYVANNNGNNVLRIDPVTGTVTVFVAAGSGGLANPVGLTFGPDGNLYVASLSDSSILKYDGSTGAFLGTFVSPDSGGLSGPDDLTFGPDGNLYVSSQSTNSVLAYNGTTGASIGTFVAPSSAGLTQPLGVRFGPDGNLYVASFGTNQVLVYQGPSGFNPGAFVAVAVSTSTVSINSPTEVAFDASGALYTSSRGTNSVIRTQEVTSGATGAGLLTLTNGSNDYSGGTVLSPSGIWAPTLLVTSATVLGTGTLFLVGATVEANTAMTIANPLDLESANVTLGGSALNDGALTFSGAVTLTGVNNVVTNEGTANPSTMTPVVLSGNISGSGSLNDAGTIVLSGKASSQTGFSAAIAGPLEIDGSQTSSPVPVTMATLDGNGTAGPLAVGGGGVVEPGTAAAVGELTAAGANFSDNGTLHLRMPGTSAGSYDVLDLTGNTLVVGGTSTLVLDLANLSGLTAATPVTGVILYGSPPPPPKSFFPAVTGRIGNVPLFNQVQIINNPNNYAVELDYTTDPVSGQPELNLVIALGASDTPTLNLPASPTTPEDVPLTFGSLSVSDLEGAAPYSAQFQATVSIPTAAGALSLAAGTPDGPLTSVLIGTNQVLTLPVVGGSTGLANLNLDLAGMTYTPTDDFTGTFALGLTVTNEGSSGLLPDSQPVSGTVHVTVTPTAPTFTIPVNPNEVVPFSSSGPNSFTFNGWATGITAEPQPASWAGGTSLVFKVTTDNPALFAAGPAIDPATGNLSFTLANPLPPVQVAHASVVLRETEPDGDVDISAAQSFTITATNSAPPTITDVIIHWGKEQASLLSMLSSGRIDIPFANISAIDIKFSQTLNPSVLPNALQVLGKFYSYTVSAPIFINSFTLEYKLTGNVLGGELGSDDITLKFNGNAVKALGNGLSATNFTQAFAVLVGDVNNDGVVNLYDQLAVVQALNIVDNGIQYLDVAGDGLVDMNDYNFVRKFTGNKLR